jgi:hypothetical protein
MAASGITISYIRLAITDKFGYAMELWDEGNPYIRWHYYGGTQAKKYYLQRMIRSFRSSPGLRAIFAPLL